jgi:hypothetical protein
MTTAPTGSGASVRAVRIRGSGSLLFQVISRRYEKKSTQQIGVAQRLRSSGAEQ